MNKQISQIIRDLKTQVIKQIKFGDMNIEEAREFVKKELEETFKNNIKFKVEQEASGGEKIKLKVIPYIEYAKIEVKS